MTRAACLGLLVAALVGSRPAEAQERAAVLRGRLDQAIGHLDSARTEQAITGLRSLIAELRPTDPLQLRVTTHLLLGEAYSSLGERDSATVQFVGAVRASPFVIIPEELFNPELRAAFVAARRSVPALGLRAPADTTIAPLTGYLPVHIGVGRPARVSLWVSGPGTSGRDSLVARVDVDTIAEVQFGLRVRDTIPLALGTYTVRAVLGSAADSLTATLRITVDRPQVDLRPSEPPPGQEAFRPEWEKGPPRPTGVVLGAVLGTAVAILPTILTHADLGNDGLDPRTMVLGLGITVGGVVGAISGRPLRPIQANIEYNGGVRNAWELQRQAIERENADRLRRAPLRIRLVREGQER